MANPDLKVTRREWTMAVSIAVATTLVMLVPYILGYALTRPGTEYTGLVVNVEDGSYLSAIGEGYHGAWLYHLPFTTEPHAPAFIEVFYLALGHLARALDLSIMQMWHLARVLASVLMFSTMIGFIALFLHAPVQRLVAYLFGIVGAGVDWSALPWERADALSGVPLDLHMPEAHPFFLAMTYPHIAVNVALLLITFWLGLHALNPAVTWRHRRIFALGAALTNFLLGIVYPFIIFLSAAVLSLYLLYLIARARKILWGEAGLLFAIYALPAPLFIYYQLQVVANPVLQIWNAQATTLSPNPLHYLLAYAPFILLGAFAVKWIVRDPNLKLRFLLIWIGSAALLLYAPITQQRRFVQGLQIPLVLVATNNHYAYSTPNDREFACANLVDRARGYGFEGYELDGTDLTQCLDVIGSAVKRARAGRPPQLVVASTLRLAGHGEHDDFSYVTDDIRKEPFAIDCLHRAEAFIKERDLADAETLKRLRGIISSMPGGQSRGTSCGCAPWVVLPSRGSPPWFPAGRRFPGPTASPTVSDRARLRRGCLKRFRSPGTCDRGTPFRPIQRPIHPPCNDPNRY